MKHLTILILIFFTFSSFAQVINVNPNPNGEPWLIGGLRVPTEKEINEIPQLKIDTRNKTKDLPTSLDNSNLQYFRPVFNQTDGCCAQASGIAYNFTYEINRARGTSANTESNQFPTHYTYNFLNGGSGSNGSFYTDGWNIIKADGCPTVATYGGLAQDATYWMSGYTNYKSGMNNRVAEIFRIDVSTPEGLETLKYWMYNHGDGSANGGIVNFSAGIGNGDYNITYDNIITSWGESVNHAMTFVGWDDNIGYDVNNDGQITNNMDITNDGLVDMRDWERGAMIMVNSWGTSWGDNGKAYVLYRLLALPTSEGGIGVNNNVSSIIVKQNCTPKLIMNVNMNHSSRNKIKIIAGASTDLSADRPAEIITFPLFSYQGGDYYMRGTSSSPIEFSLDITPLLSYINSGEQAKIFLGVIEDDPSSEASGTIYSLSVEDGEGDTFNSTQTNVSIINNDTTFVAVQANATFDAPEITTNSLPDATVNTNYSTVLAASGGTSPYSWQLKIDYDESTISETYPNITSNQITTDNDDDGCGMQVIDFDFPFYGNNYDTLYIRTDGSIVFESGFTYLRSEDAIRTEKTISVFASDLMIYPDQNDGIFYEGDDTHATFRWKTSLYGIADANIDVAVTLYPNGEIKFYYGNNITWSDISQWAAGVSNGEGSYTITSTSGSSSAGGTQIKFVPSDFPLGLSMSKDGIYSGIPKETGTWTLTFVVTDYDNISKQKDFNFQVKEANLLNSHEADVEIYPNPADDFINISANNEITAITITDVAGKELRFYSHINDEKTTISVKNLVKGTYFVRVTTQDRVILRKFIKR